MAINLAPGPLGGILSTEDEAYDPSMLSSETSDNAAFQSLTSPALSETDSAALFGKRGGPLLSSGEIAGILQSEHGFVPYGGLPSKGPANSPGALPDKQDMLSSKFDMTHEMQPDRVAWRRARQAARILAARRSVPDFLTREHILPDAFAWNVFLAAVTGAAFALLYRGYVSTRGILKTKGA